MRRIFSSFFAWLEDEDYIIKSPVRRIHRVRTDTLIKETISDEALEHLRDSCTEIRDLALIDLLASTGMRGFASNYPDFPYIRIPIAELRELPISQATLDQIATSEGFGQVRLDQITWYHHISLIPRVKSNAERAFYIMETAASGWSRDVMLMQIANKYINAKGKAITNFQNTLPAYQSDLAQYAFKDPYNFSFLGTVALQNERDIEINLAKRITDFLLEMGRGFAYIGRQYHLSVDGDDYYIDLMMYHLQLH